MKYKFLVIILLFIAQFFLLSDSSFAAGTCKCSYNYQSGNVVSENQCDSTSEAVCSGSAGDCTCEPKVAGCKKSGQLGAGETCCPGYDPFPVKDFWGNAHNFCSVSGYNPVLLVQTNTLFCSPDPSHPTNKGINTALGCIDTDITTGGFLKSILSLSVGLGGGIALLLMLYGTFIITTSAGIPDKLSQGKEIITSAAIGLIFIILSIVLMNLIGVSILGLPGL